jgi:hypothetical protein
MIPGVPIVNPLWDRHCPIGSGCQPYLNPSAFERPALGQLGNAPRTIPWARGPLQRFTDVSVQKNFRIGEKYRLQVRVDALNIFNHPVFAVYPNNGGGADFMGAPSTATLTTSLITPRSTATSITSCETRTARASGICINRDRRGMCSSA